MGKYRFGEGDQISHMTSSYKLIIQNRLSISDYIGRYVNLKSKGSDEYVAVCPFHQEKTPSFTVSNRKSFFHCFGCGAHGNVIDFAMKFHGLNYLEALKKLGNEIGLKDINYDEKKDSNIKQYYAIYNEMAEWYHQELFSKHGIEALRYITNRGVTIETVKKYQIGYASNNSRVLVSNLLKKFNKETLLQSKALYKDTLIDPFSGRIIFPIHDIQSKVIGFGGRIISNGSKHPKYLNSSESPIFHKGQIFYGMHTVKSQKEIRPLSKLATDSKMLGDLGAQNRNVSNIREDLSTKSTQQFATEVELRKRSIIVVEGYMDVLSLHSNGICNVVAPLGANIKEEQIKLLWRYTDSPIICFDNDASGRAAMERAAYSALPNITPDKNIYFIILEDYKDPDELIKNLGAKHWSKLLDNKFTLADFIFKIKSQKCNIKVLEHRAKLRDELSQISKTIKHSTLSSEYNYYLISLYWKLIKANRHRVANKYFFTTKSNKKDDMVFGECYNEQRYLKNYSLVADTKDYNAEHMLVLFGLLLKHPQLLCDECIVEELWCTEVKDEYFICLRNLLMNHLGEEMSIDDILRENTVEGLDIRKFKTMLQNIMNISSTLYTSNTTIEVIKNMVLKAFKLNELEVIKTQIFKIESMIQNENDEVIIEELQQKILNLKKHEHNIQQELVKTLL